MRRWLPLATLACFGCAADAGLAVYNLQMGDMLLVKRDYHEALPFYDKAIAADPTLAEPYLHRGLAHRGKRNFDEAIADFTKAVELNPMLGRAYMERARARIQQLGDDKAKLDDAFGKADPLGLEPDLNRAATLSAGGGDDTAFLVRAAVRIVQKRDAEAKDDIDRWLRRRPKLATDVGNAAAAWTKERPVLNFELIDALVRVRPKPS